MFVPAWQVLPFTFVKRPIVCALWYAVLAHLIFEPFSTTAIIVSSAVLAISFFNIRFFLAILSPIPMIISIVIVHSKYPDLFYIFLIAGIIWSILCIIAAVVTYRTAKNIYYIDPVTNIMYKN